MKTILTLLVCWFTCLTIQGQIHDITVQSSPTDQLLIGLHILDEQTVWASGTGATVVFTSDGGQSWNKATWDNDPKLQFRDIHGFSATQAVVLSSGTGADSRIYTLDTSQNTWLEVYRMPHETGFLDALAFWDASQGIAYGDAVSGKPFILITTDGGQNWLEVPGASLPDAGPGEGGFASSGTNIALPEPGVAIIGTGAGGNARLLITQDFGKTWSAKETPMVKGEAAGITSVRMLDAQRGIIAGGDLGQMNSYLDQLYLTQDQGETWTKINPSRTPGPIYGSALTRIGQSEVLITTGPKGAQVTEDWGRTWQPISDQNLWSTDLHSSGVGYLVGQKGMILKWTYHPQK